MKLCIAEKPSVAREIARVLGARQKREGYMEGNGYCVSWTFGHLCTLKEPQEYDEAWKSWRLDRLPILPERFDIKLIKRKGISKQFNTIKRLLQQAQEVINCGDAGQEGELIQRWVLQLAGNKKPVKRLWISSLTPQAIRQGFQNLKDARQYDRLFQAGRSRAIGDWLLGMNATRLYTVKFGGYKNVLSIGRVQTPTLALIVERHREIENFKPETYWLLRTQYRKVWFDSAKGKLDSKEKAQQLFDYVQGVDFHITDFKQKEGKENAPQLHDLTALQVECNKRLNLSADQTLKIAQLLYERKLISYPRVDTRYLPSDVYPKVPGILQKLQSLQPQLVAPLLGKKLPKSKRVFNDAKITDHHAIMPTGQLPGKLNPVQQQVYQRILLRFLAVFYPPCLVLHSTVLGRVKKLEFKATGKQILKPGWRVVYGTENLSSASAKKKKGKKEETQLLPAFQVGESGAHQPKIEEKQTQPPKPYTEASLLRAMETAGRRVDDEELRELMKSNGIGRPSTRANIIETLFRRKYVQRRRKTLVPTDKGQQLMGIIQKDLLKSAELTGQWERKLRDIEQGKFEEAQFLQEMRQLVKELVQEVQQQAPRSIQKPTKKWKKKPNEENKLSKSREKTKKASADLQKGAALPGVVCPRCGQGKLLVGNSAYGCSRYKEGCQFRIPFVVKGKKLPLKQVLRIAERGSSILLRGFQENGKKVNGRLQLDAAQELQFEPC